MRKPPPVMKGMTFESDCIVNGKLIKAGTLIPFAAPSSAVDLIPVNWLDPLLTGPTAVLQGSGPWGCPDIERLLIAVREKVRSATEPRWIPVAERLPDDGLNVLIAIEKPEGEPVWIGFHEGEQWFSDDAMPQRVTHWKPMIAGPKP